MANEPNFKGLNIQSDFAVGLKAINFQTDLAVGLKALNLQIDSSGALTIFNSNTAFKSVSSLN